MTTAASIRERAVNQLCLQCGLCCNGALFVDVRLRAGEDASALERLGLPLRRLGRSQHPALAQPCAAFHEGRCVAYACRPSHCREFECGILRRVIEGSLNLSAAQARLNKARRQFERVNKLLRACGQTDESRPLHHRYRQVMRQPIDLASPQRVIDARARLMRAMDRWMRLVYRELLTVPGSKSR